MRTPRPRTLAIGALVVLLAATPFIPRGADEEGDLLPSGDPGTRSPRLAETAGRSKLTPEMKAEIDRVVAAGRTAGRVASRAGALGAVDSLVRCAEFEGQRYCLGTGWTEQTQADVRDRWATAARRAMARAATADRNTGDLDAVAALERTARMSTAARAAAERAELTQAARSVAKVWLLRHDIEGVPLPRGFLTRHPEARAPLTTASPTTMSRTSTTSTTSSTGTSTSKDGTTTTTVARTPVYPRKDTVLHEWNVSSQSRTYWCGPTTMQMIVWGWRHYRQSQAHWADRLNTTTSGTAISDMVRIVNRTTGWDRETRAGPYITLDIGDWSYKKWNALILRHIHDYRAPIVMHPLLHKEFFPYLDDDASGHFQVGRGYNKRGTKPNLVGYFEPWNQQRFDPSEPYIDRVQWRLAYRSYRANQAHFQHNIGV